jgi:hypothetical protein
MTMKYRIDGTAYDNSDFGPVFNWDEPITIVEPRTRVISSSGLVYYIQLSDGTTSDFWENNSN